MSDHRHMDNDDVPEPLRPVMDALCATAAALSERIARGPLDGDPQAVVGENAGGDGQKALDVTADEAFAAAMPGCSVRWYASEEREDAVAVDTDGHWALAIDPLDGSSNIDTNVSVGTIFSLYEARDTAAPSFLRPAREQIAAGYFVYGPQTSLVATFGSGTFLYVFDRDEKRFLRVGATVAVPQTSREFAINASNYRRWPNAVRSYIDDCLAGEKGPLEADHNMRWVGSLVADAQRILARGGVYIYPGDERPGYARGRLRMLYEAAPIAFVMSQAGGDASDGTVPIMDQAADSLHARTPLMFGSRGQIAVLRQYHEQPARKISALFGHRGLFR